MTLQQIEKIKATISKLENLKTKPTPTDISRVDSSLENFFHELYKSPYLNISNYFAYDMEITKEQMLADIDDIVSVLNGMLALDPKAAQISDVLELIFEGEHIEHSYEAIQKYISKVFYSYGDYIKLDKSIIAVATRAIKTDVDIEWGFKEENSIDYTVVEGILRKLRIYAQEVLEGKKESTKKASAPSVVINNNPSISATASANAAVDISIVFENAVRQVEDACLPDAQEKEVLAKIQELKDIMESKESKGKRWAKIRDVFKWVAEQGIQVASIIVPLLATTIK
ncbi:MAG: hypothetical protein J6B80_07225 [Clostridia bacterium]|nr:hypothetical protein [Clostridia bacterium]